MTFPGSAALSAITPFQWFAAGGIFCAFVLAGVATRVVVFSVLKKWFEKTETRIDDIILGASQFHIYFWAVLAGVHYGLVPLHLPNRLQSILHHGIVVAFGISVTLWAARIMGESITYLTSRMKGEQAGASSLIVNLGRVLVIVLGGLLILSNLGISITPLLTALGVGSLAVALALQDTLSNIFAGFYMLISRQIRPGDYIRIDSGQEGHVMDIGWRATRLKEQANDIIIVPNSKMAQAIVTNFDMPEMELACLIPMGVGYDSDLTKVEQVIAEVGKDVQMNVEGGVRDFQPFIRYNAFADSSVNFTVILRARSFVDRGLLTHEFIKRAHTRLKQENIDIPFPQRVIHVKQTAPV
jgi:small-conductance mechanosensitive channel